MSDSKRSEVEQTLRAFERIVSSLPLQITLPSVHLHLCPGQDCTEQMNDALGGGGIMPPTMSEILRRIPRYLALIIHVDGDVEPQNAARFLCALHAAHQVYPIGIAVVGKSWIHEPDRRVLGSTFGGSAHHVRHMQDKG